MFHLLGVTLLVLVYLYTIRNYSYWAKRKVKHDVPVPLFGNHFRTLAGLLTEPERALEVCARYSNESIIGYYKGATPELVVKDPEILKHIFNQDFACFHARGLGRNPDKEPLMLNVFSVDGDYWRLLRPKLSSAFTVGKLRSTFPLIVQCAEKLQHTAKEIATSGREVNAYDLTARFTIEFIGACGFGIETKTLDAEHSSFLRLGRIIFHKSTTQLIMLALRELFPDVKFIQNMYIANEEVKDVIINILNEIRQQRGGKPSERNDFVDLLLVLEAAGKLRGESIEKRNPDGTPSIVELEMNPLCSAAQLFIYFAAGFETSSSSTSYALHQLAFHPKIQRDAQRQIDETLARYGGKLCYDAVVEMSLLEMTMKEALRMFPPAGFTTRVCTTKYTIPGTDVTIDPGVRIFVPIQALHMDPKYYENPTEFRPERFTLEEIKKRHKYVYLPFGEGPRKCLGARLGLMQSMAALAALLQHYTVVPGPSSTRNLRRNRKSYLVQVAEGGLPIILKPRKLAGA